MRCLSSLDTLRWRLAWPALACALASPAHALSIDTGPGIDWGGGWSLYDDRPQTSGYQSLAALFSVDAAQDTVTSVQAWMNWGYGGTLTFSVRAMFQGLPGALLHSTRVNLPATTLNLPDWRGVGGLQWQLQAGDYWLVFEDGRDPGSGALPAGAANPLGGYASSPGLLGATWMRADTLGFGVRINFSPEPPPLPAVPEPAVALLLASGLGMLGAAARRRAAQAPSPAGADLTKAPGR